MHFTVLDYTAIVFYLAATLLVGLFFRARSSGNMEN